MTEQRLPMVDGDDGNWGYILNQYLAKEHYNTGVDNAANGGHKTVTLQPGTVTAGTAPLKFSSGSLLATPEAGAVEYSSGSFYMRGTDKLSVAGSVTASTVIASTLTSNVNTGTAPLTVSSTTAVTNLNADTVDSVHATGFATAAQGTLATNALPAASYTAADVLIKIETVDGSGSGLDADTVDGSHLLDILKAVYPVGCIYLAVLSTSPATLFSFGTWVAWGTGQVPVGVNTSDTNFNTIEKTGGSDTVILDSTMVPNHTHTATAATEASHTHSGTTGNQNALHTHSPLHNQDFLGIAVPNSQGLMNSPAIQVGGDNTTSTESVYHQHLFTTGAGIAHTHIVTVNTTTGGGAAHSNLQPYITCYMWKRTA